MRELVKFKTISPHDLECFTCHKAVPQDGPVYIWDRSGWVTRQEIADADVYCSRDCGEAND